MWEEGLEAKRAWTELADQLAGADVVVAYNGTGLDYPLVREAAERAGCADPLAGHRLVDALYLAHAVWPTAPSHRLHAPAREDLLMTTPILVDQLLTTADQLLAGGLMSTPAARHRGAALALRTALEITIDHTLDSVVPGLAATTTRAKLLCLHRYTTPQTARRAGALWAHLCLGIHYHQYEIGPTHDQVHTWRTEVQHLLRELAD